MPPANRPTVELTSDRKEYIYLTRRKSRLWFAGGFFSASHNFVGRNPRLAASQNLDSRKVAAAPRPYQPWDVVARNDGSECSTMLNPPVFTSLYSIDVNTIDTPQPISRGRKGKSIKIHFHFSGHENECSAIVLNSLPQLWAGRRCFGESIKMTFHFNARTKMDFSF